MPVRKHAGWMVRLDERLLECLRETAPATSDALVTALDDRLDGPGYRVGQVAARCQRLHQHGLVEVTGAREWLLTDRGAAFLDGDLDATTLAPRGEPR